MSLFAQAFVGEVPSPAPSRRAPDDDGWPGVLPDDVASPGEPLNDEAPGVPPDDDAWPGVPPAPCRPGELPGDVTRLTDDALITALRATETLGRRIDAVRAALAAEVAERSRRELGPEGLARRLGCRTPVELLQRVTGAASVTVNRLVRVGRAVRPATRLSGDLGPSRFPHVALAMADGLLGVDAAAAVVDTLRPTLRVADAAAVGAAERSIVDEAASRSPDASPRWDADSVRTQAQVWAAVLDPDGAEPTESDLQRRGLQLLAPRNGLVPVRGNLVPDVAAALRTYADACTNPRSAALPGPDPSPFAAPDPTTLIDGAAAPRDDCEPPPDPRSSAQRLHDVLAAVIGAAARCVDAPSVAGNAPTLVVTVRAEDLVAGSGAAFVDGSALTVGLTAARHVGCAGAVQQVVIERSGRIAGIGSPGRCFTGSQRRAIAVRDGTCVIPGCHVPAAWCEVHHAIPHADDPDGTHTDNGVLLCWFHHRTIETSGWQVRMRAGLPEVKAPPWLDPDRTWRRSRGSPQAVLDAITATTTDSRQPTAPPGAV